MNRVGGGREERKSGIVCTLEELARGMADDGEEEAKIDGMMVPQPCEDWLFSAFFALNMRFLCQRRLEA